MSNILKRFDKISKRAGKKEKRAFVIENKGAAQRYADNVARELKHVKK